MKTILVFIILLYLPTMTDSAVNTRSIKTGDHLSSAEPTSQNQRDGKVAMKDHAVLQGEKATDAGGASPTEHLAPLILMVLAFLISFVAGCLWWSRMGDLATLLMSSMITMAVMSTVFSFASGLLLANAGSYLSHTGQTGESDDLNFVQRLTHSHHWPEILFCVLSVVILIVVFILLNRIRVNKYPKGSYLTNSLIFVTSAFQLVVIIILLNIFPKNNWRLCDDTCVMLGSQAGIAFDMPCSDNVAFMALHHASQIIPKNYIERFVKSEVFPHYLDYASAIAMHDPIYPGYRKTGLSIRSEPITFSLDEDKRNLIDTCTLLTYCYQFTKHELLTSNIDFKQMVNAGLKKVATWTRNGGTFDKHDAMTGTVQKNVNNISHEKHFVAKTDKITYITYRFEFAYKNQDTLTAQPRDTVTVTFALQDYHKILPDFPAPVYVQGDMLDVMDVLFIPAKGSAGNTEINEAFLNDFRKNCRLIIKDALFKEPSIRFWRKQFNFWINYHPGQAMNASCDDCCHVPPENLDEASDTIYVSDDIEFRALLHKEGQWDFTDHCSAMFSAEMDLVADYNENSSFLHEFGHAAFGLSDEYSGGNNVEAREHLPNVWETRSRARIVAELRHKKKDDAIKLR